MKKLVAIMTALSLFSYAAAAETVIVVLTPMATCCKKPLPAEAH